ncbi:flavin reductase family protein [Hydrogenimonas sp.]
MRFSYDELAKGDIYKLMSQSIVPRPIAWVVTERGGVVNVAPFSYFTGLSSEPPTLLISVGHRSDGSPKDTLRNLREAGRATVCLATPSQLEPLHKSSAPLPPEASEAAEFGIETIRDEAGFPPRVAQSPVAFYCTLLQEVALEGSSTIPLVLKIHAQFVDDGCVMDTERLTLSFEPLARVGRGYARLGESLEPPVI